MRTAARNQFRRYCWSGQIYSRNMAAPSQITFTEGVIHTEGSFKNPRGFDIFTQSWVPAQPVASLVLVHGLGEHSTRYTHFARHLTQYNIAVYTLDHEAHGRSQGEKEYVESVQHLVDDIITYSQTVHAIHSDLPRFLFGHSLGGCVSINLCVQQPNLFQYGIFSAPTTSRPPSVNAVLKALGGIVGKLGPRLRLTPLDTSTLCRTPEVVQAYFADPLIWREKIAVGFGSDILVSGDALIDNAVNFTIPALFMAGSADLVVSSAGSHKFFERCASQDKTYISLTDWYHELINEPEGDQLMSVVTNWIKERLELTPGSTISRNAHKTGVVTNGELIIQDTQ